VGLETAVPLTLALVREGLLSPLRAIELLSWGPARIFRLPGGRIEAGHPADLTVIDPDVEWEIDAARFESKGRNTPFHGWKVQGRAVQTVVGGRIVYEAGR
jgi:dihydroorotase